MKLFKIATLSIALLAGPALAQSGSATHELRWNQAGKIPTATYHPIKRNCGPTASPIHLAGKTPLIVHAKSSDCARDIAAVDHKTPVVLADNN